MKHRKENAWNLTDETYYSYEGTYVSKQNEAGFVKRRKTKWQA